MGEHTVSSHQQAEELRVFLTCLLRDVRALEKILNDGMIESGVRRIGAEQELFLVNPAWRPAPVAMEILEILKDRHFTTELARFNLEINLDPLEFDGGCLSRMESQLDELLVKVRAAANNCGAEILLMGILPTIRKSDLGLDNMSPIPRYFLLNSALKKLRSGANEFRIKGTDELIVKHDSMMIEACCTSFQFHVQVGLEEFANLYNLAQVATAPALAAATFSPLLFGRRLWRETRIPLFQQAVDTRSASFHLRERSPRVSFGHRWVRQSPLELFQEDISRFRVLFGAQLEEDPFALLQQGLPPELQALRIYNGTVYRWNRACYGISNGKAHLRIENRVLPSGPTVIDEIANAAFFLGMLHGLATEYPNITEHFEFEDAYSNFLGAARVGLDAQLTWLGGKVIPAQELITDQLLPLARHGLASTGIVPQDIDRYLGVIQERVASGRTGSQWLLQSLSEIRREGTRNEVYASLTAAAVKRQREGLPVHQWTLAQFDEAGTRQQSYLRVEEFMTTDLFTVHQDEPLDLVVHLMNWKHIRHVPVEDEQGRLVGLISCFEVLHQISNPSGPDPPRPIPVSSIMKADPITVRPETSTLDAIALMRHEKVDCLPVVQKGRLVGIVTEADFLDVAARLLKQRS
jgi:CBS domain-containing protein